MTGTTTNVSLFDGDGDLEGPVKDARLKRQVERVFDYMCNGRWCTLKQIAEAVNASEASVSARIRDLRKPRFGGWWIEKQMGKTSGVHLYKLVLGSGDPELVANPLPRDAQTSKAEARAFLESYVRNARERGWHVSPELLDAIEVMLR